MRHEVMQGIDYEALEHTEYATGVMHDNFEQLVHFTILNGKILNTKGQTVINRCSAGINDYPVQKVALHPLPTHCFVPVGCFQRRIWNAQTFLCNAFCNLSTIEKKWLTSDNSAHDNVYYYTRVLPTHFVLEAKNSKSHYVCVYFWTSPTAFTLLLLV